MKLAIISSYHENCGIAAYTERLEPEFRKYFDVDVIKLNTEVLKSTHKELLRLGDLMISEIAQQVKDYDCVNIQFEAGLYGCAAPVVQKRIFKILDNCKNVIFTFHSVNFNTPRLNKRQLFSKRFVSTLRDYFAAKRWPRLYDSLIKKLKQIDGLPSRKANVVVHDLKTERFISRVYHFEHIWAHPLGLTPRSERNIQHTAEEKKEFNSDYFINEGQKTVGIFGFISEYKGHLAALQAVRQLPTEYHLLIFGAQHPASIQAYVPVDAYLARLLDYIKECDSEDIKKAFSAKKEIEKVVLFSSRVHFCGNVDDAEFARAMRCCDVVILPYVEVNQMGSGIAAQALENHANAILTNTKCFQELGEFFPGCFDICDIGNYMQLAQQIRHYRNTHTAQVDKALERYNIENNVKKYVELFERN